MDWDTPPDKESLMLRRDNLRQAQSSIVHLHRTVVQMRSGKTQPGKEAHVYAGRLVLNEFSPTGVYLFSQAHLPVGEPLSLVIENPRKFYCKAKVEWTKDVVTETHIFSKEKFQVRMSLKFVFASEEEKKAAQSYFEELNKELRSSNRSRKAA